MLAVGKKLVAIALLLSTAGAASAQAPGIQWGGDLEAAKSQAQSTGKLVLVHFWTPSCGPCRILDQQVFNQPTVAGPVQQNFVPVKLNANEFAATAQAFGITRVPTDVVITPTGQVVEKFVSPSSPMAYVGRMTTVAGNYANREGAKYQTAANQSPYGPAANASTSAPVNNAYANLSLGAAPAQTAPGASVANPYMAASQTAVAPQTPQASAPQASPAVATAGVGDRYASAAPAPTSVANPYMPAATAPATPPAASQPAIQPTAAQVASQPAPAVEQKLPAGAPPVGFDGYCPITMKREWKWVKGDAKWGAIHRGRTYLFAGQTERDEFLQNPDAFSPVFSGVDPVLALEQGKAVPGTRSFALEYRGHFYMFSSEETLNKFWTNAESYSSGVRQAMAGTPEKMVR